MHLWRQVCSIHVLPVPSRRLRSPRRHRGEIAGAAAGHRRQRGPAAATTTKATASATAKTTPATAAAATSAAAATAAATAAAAEASSKVAHRRRLSREVLHVRRAPLRGEMRIALLGEFLPQALGEADDQSGVVILAFCLRLEIAQQGPLHRRRRTQQISAGRLVHGILLPEFVELGVEPAVGQHVGVLLPRQLLPVGVTDQQGGVIGLPLAWRVEVLQHCPLHFHRAVQ
mmetsp:Transcript_113896/g.327289  ORF Transcript_113896/g.327289 Transcript_113896/m.327289 type:complete len:230 (-) Transcript_113896:1260-1949(-)